MPTRRTCFLLTLPLLGAIALHSGCGPEQHAETQDTQPDEPTLDYTSATFRTTTGEKKAQLDRAQKQVRIVNSQTIELPKTIDPRSIAVGEVSADDYVDLVVFGEHEEGGLRFLVYLGTAGGDFNEEDPQDKTFDGFTSNEGVMTVSDVIRQNSDSEDDDDISPPGEPDEQSTPDPEDLVIALASGSQAGAKLLIVPGREGGLHLKEADWFVWSATRSAEIRPDDIEVEDLLPGDIDAGLFDGVNNNGVEETTTGDLVIRISHSDTWRLLLRTGDRSMTPAP